MTGFLPLEGSQYLWDALQEAKLPPFPTGLSASEGEEGCTDLCRPGCGGEVPGGVQELWG